MSRTIKEIYTAIITEKDSLDSLKDLGYTADDTELLLQDLNSSSKVAIWRLWAYITAVTIYFHEKLWDLFKTEVEEKLKAIPGTDTWLVNECRKFQMGDTLAFNSDGTYGYASLKPEDQIIKRVAVTGNFGASVVKIATQDEEEGPLRALNPEELTAFQGYLNLIQYAGSSVTAVSNDSDQLKFSIEVFHNALVPLSTLQVNVQGAINDYLANLEFNGAFRVIKLVDAIQDVEGVLDVSIHSLLAKAADAAEFVNVSRVYEPNSGYFQLISDLNDSEVLKLSVE